MGITQSINVRCEADVDMRSGVTKCLLLADPLDPFNGDHLRTSMRRSTVDLRTGKYYRVTFEEVPGPGGLAPAPEAA